METQIPKQITLEEDIRCQRLVNDLYELLEKHGLNSIIIWDKDSKKLKEIDSVSINGNAMQINSESWIGE